MLSSYLIGKVSHEEPRLVRFLQRLYSPALYWALSHSRSVTLMALALLVLAGVVYTQIGKSFMPTMDEGDLIVQLEKLPSISLQESIDIDMRVQRAIMQRVPEVAGVVARAGSDELGLDPMGLNETDSFLVLKSSDQWRMNSKDELVAEVRKVLDDFPGVGYAFTQPIEMRVSEMLTGVRGDLAVKIFGDDQAQLNASADAIVNILKGIRGAVDVYTPRNEGAQYYRLVADPM